MSGPAMSSTHVVVIPSYDTGPLVYATVAAARAAWSPVWIVVDGSRDGTAEGLRAMAAEDPGLRVDVLAENSGKGAAVLHALEAARAEGFTHAAEKTRQSNVPGATTMPIACSTGMCELASNPNDATVVRLASRSDARVSASASPRSRRWSKKSA